MSFSRAETTLFIPSAPSSVHDTMDDMYKSSFNVCLEEAVLLQKEKTASAIQFPFPSQSRAGDLHPEAVILRVRSLDQQHQHHPANCQECKFSDPPVGTGSHKLGMKSSNLHFNKPSRRLYCKVGELLSNSFCPYSFLN